MSFLTRRIGAWFNKNTSDPEAEKDYRKQQAEAKEAIRFVKQQLTNEKNLLTLIKARKQVYEEDFTVIEKKLADGFAFLESGATEIPKEDVMANYMDNYGAEAYGTFRSNAYAVGSTDGATGSRYLFWQLIRTAKQAKHDNPKAPKEVLLDLETIQKRYEGFQKDNVNSAKDNYLVFNQDIVNEFFNKSTSAELNKVWQPAWLKILANKELDFQEGVGIFNEEKATPAQKKAEIKRQEKAKDEFSVVRMLFNASNYAITVFTIAIVVFISMMGSSMAVNLNVYKPYPFKVLYAIYGFVFSLIVVPYVVFYRWLYKGKRPKYYGFLPFIPRFFTNTYVQFLFGWLTYRPDERMWELQEWRQARDVVKMGVAASAADAQQQQQQQQQSPAPPPSPSAPPASAPP